MNRRVRAIAAAVFLAFLVFGVPFVLIRLVGWPLPEQVPDVDNVLTRLRQGDIPAEAVINTLAVVVWLAWFQLAFSILWEAIVNVPRLSSGRVWRPPPLVFSPVGEGVARLVSVILAAGVIASSSPGIATALSAPSVAGEHLDTPATLDISSTATEASLDASDQTATPLWRVSADDDLWSIAEQALGDGSLVDQIVELNPGLSARTLRAGMLLEMPEGASVAQPAASSTADDGTARHDREPTDIDPGASPLPAAQHDPSPTLDAIDDSAADVANDPAAASLDDGVARYVVQENDGMWNVAEALLGDGSRHVEMTELAVGQQVAPGVVFDAETFVIHPGWVFTDQPGTAPDADSTEGGDEEITVVVERGDTLSEIAEDHLGDADDWPEIWEANRGDDMGAGRTFDDPNLILPGWELDVPVDPEATIERVPETIETSTDDDAVSADAPAPADDGGDADTTGDDDVEVADSFDDVAIDADTDAPEVGGDGPVASDDIADDVAPDERDEITPVLGIPVTVVEAPAIPAGSTSTSEPGGGVSGASSADSSIRDTDAPRAPSPVRMEYAALLAAGVLTLVGVRRRRALRAALPHARVPAPPPEIAATERRLRTIDAGERAARVDIAARAIAHAIVGTGVGIGTIRAAKDGELLVRLTGTADLTAPWEGHDDAWVLPASVPIEMLSDDARRAGQPCLALVTVGLDSEDRDVLIDLEAAGTTMVAAQPDQADDVVRAIGAGLATSLNAETIHLVTASLGTEFLLDHPNAHGQSSVAAACDAAISFVGSTLANDRSSFDLRTRRTGGEMWEPAVVLLARDDDAGASSDLATFTEPARGLALVAAASTTPVPAASVGARLAARSDGWTLDAFGEQIDISPIGVGERDVADIADLLDDAARPIEPSRAVPRAAAEAVADPITPIPHDVVVRLMGGVEIVDADGNPGAFERSKTVELISWLATHREHATRTAARTALWELDVRDATFANVVSEARRGLGRLTPPPEGEEWLARTLNESLPLHERVVTDADLIEQRVTHARLAPPAHAVDVLRPAVAMVTGLPFAGTSYLWPDADGITSNLVLLATTAACELAAHALSMGDTDLVFWATGQGLKVLPGHEELIGLRMRAHARAGDLAGVRSEWESYERVINADSWSDGEPAPKLLDLRRVLLTGGGH